MRRIKLQDRAALIQGDCFDAYQKLKSVDFIFTDPPYGHDNNEDDLMARREHALKDQDEEKAGVRPIQNDDYETANRLFTDSLPWWHKLLPKGGFVCCCCGGGGGRKGIQYARWSLQLGDVFQFEQAVPWDKGPIGMGWHYRRSHENILVAMRQGGKPYWYDQSGTVENIIRPGDYGIHATDFVYTENYPVDVIRPGDHGIKKIIPSAKQHPTEKPPELAALFIRLHTQPNDVVFDPFMGSGSTGVAALSLGRKFIGVELDPGWFEEARKRLEYVIQHGYDLPPAKKKPARSTKQLRSPGLWGSSRQQ